MNLSKPMLGTAHGNRIDLDEPLSFDEGQRIIVEVKSTIDEAETHNAIRRLGGLLADLPEAVDDDLREIIASRRETTYREVEP